MDASEIRWNDQAREKILNDSDRVLREAVLDLAKTRGDDSADDLFAEINTRMKGRFIDYEPGPDVRKYAEAIAAGEFSGQSGSPKDPGVADAGGTDDRGNATTSGSAAAGSGAAGSGAAGSAAAGTAASGGSAPLDSQNGNGIAADPGQGALAPDGDRSDEVVNDG